MGRGRAGGRRRPAGLPRGRRHHRDGAPHARTRDRGDRRRREAAELGAGEGAGAFRRGPHRARRRDPRTRHGPVRPGRARDRRQPARAHRVDGPGPLRRGDVRRRRGVRPDPWAAGRLVDGGGVVVIDEHEYDVEDLRPCCEGVIPAIIATAGADGVPNITYLSCAHLIDRERIALSNQFFSKTSRNIAENPQASLILIDPHGYRQFRLTLNYERTDRHGPAFEALRRHVDTVAALQGMQDVSRLRAADVYRILRVERLREGIAPNPELTGTGSTTTGGPAEIAELSMRLGRASDLDTLVATALRGLDELLGFRHSILMLVDETGNRLYTIASHGYAAEGVGSEAQVGYGTIGVAADQCRAVNVSNVRSARRYAAALRTSFEAEGQVAPGAEIPMPGLEDVEAQLAVPAMAMGRLVGVLMVESGRRLAFDDGDEAVLAVVA